MKALIVAKRYNCTSLRDKKSLYWPNTYCQKFCAIRKLINLWCTSLISFYNPSRVKCNFSSRDLINDTLKCLIDFESAELVINLCTKIHVPLKMVYLCTINSKANISQSFYTVKLFPYNNFWNKVFQPYYYNSGFNNNNGLAIKTEWLLVHNAYM